LHPPGIGRYRAPEISKLLQSRFEGRDLEEIDASKTDVYSLGIMLNDIYEGASLSASFQRLIISMTRRLPKHRWSCHRVKEAITHGEQKRGSLSISSKEDGAHAGRPFVGSVEYFPRQICQRSLNVPEFFSAHLTVSWVLIGNLIN
jgi:serine/threonine protein kinase